MKQFISMFVGSALIATLAACSSTTVIRSTDSSAKIFVDGEFRGKGSVTHTDTKTIGSVTSVRIEKEGCEPMGYTFARNEEFDGGACAGGVFLLVPFLWVQKYKAEHVYDYQCEKKK